MMYSTIFRYWAIGLILLFSTISSAQETATLEIGDTVAVTLAADEIISFQIELNATQSILMTLNGDVSASARLLDGEGRWRGDVHLDDTNIESIGRGLARDTDIYQIEIKNDDDVTGNISLSLSDVPSYEIDIGEPYEFTLDQEPIFEVAFSGNAGQNLILEVSPESVFYIVEIITVDGELFDFYRPPAFGYPIAGFELREAIGYRIVVYTEFISDETEVGTEAFIEIREPTILSDTVTIGSIIQDTAHNELVQYSIDLEADQELHATVLSVPGSQLYMTDSEGTVLEYFGHAAVPHEFAPLEFIAPDTDTYTIHILNPSLGNLFDGDFTFVVSDQAVLRLVREPLTIDINSGQFYVFWTAVSEGQQYRLTISSEDELDGTILVEIYELPHLPLLEDEITSATVEFSFEAENDAGVVLILTGLDDIDATVSVSIESTD